MDKSIVPDHHLSGPPPRDPFGAATFAIDPDIKNQDDQDDSNDDDSEWEYEYSTTETQTYYITLDMSIPDLEIQQPNSFAQSSATKNKRWRNPLNEPLSHIHDKILKNLAIDSGDEDDDEDDNNFIPPPPENDDMPHFREPRPNIQDKSKPDRGNTKGKGKATDKASGGIPRNPWGRYDTDMPDSQEESEDEQLRRDGAKQANTKAPGGGLGLGKRPPGHMKTQVLSFHDASPVFLHNGRTYIGQWGRVIGTDMIFTKNVEGDRFPILRNLKDGVDLVAVCSARIMTTEVEFTPKENNIDDEDYQAQFRHEVIRRRGRTKAEDRGVDNKEEEQQDMRRRADEEQRLKWLMNLQAIKREKGETDFVPLVLLPAEGDSKAAKKRGTKSAINLRRRIYLRPGEQEPTGSHGDDDDDEEEEQEDDDDDDEDYYDGTGPSTYYHPYNLPTVHRSRDVPALARENEEEEESEGVVGGDESDDGSDDVEVDVDARSQNEEEWHAFGD